MRVFVLKYFERLVNTNPCRRVSGCSFPWCGLRRLTVLLESLDGGDHLAVQFASGRVEERAFARSVVVLQVLRIGSVSDRPLRSLFDGKEAELAIAFARRRLALAEFGADTTRRLACSVAYEQNLLQARDCLLGASNDNRVAD